MRINDFYAELQEPRGGQFQLRCLPIPTGLGPNVRVNGRLQKLRESLRDGKMEGARYREAMLLNKSVHRHPPKQGLVGLRSVM